MATRGRETIVGVWLDLLSVKILVSLLTWQSDPDLTSEAHLYFFDRYQRLADHARARGHHARAKRFQRKANDHFERGGGDGPPYRAAIGMPRPRHWINTNAVSSGHRRGPDDAA